MIGIVIPVFNEGPNIREVIQSLVDHVKTSYCVFICFDFEEDDTLPEVRKFDSKTVNIELVKNKGRGPHSAVVGGITAALQNQSIEAVIVFPADDTFNAPILDRMYNEFKLGSEVVCASRFMKGGTMKHCPWLKALLVRSAAFTMYHLARVPTHDPTSGFRLFSRRILENIKIESHRGFTYSLELLVKTHRLGWQISEVPAQWIERESGQSRFKVIKWLPAYLQWYKYAFATTYCAKARSRSEAGRLLKP